MKSKGILKFFKSLELPISLCVALIISLVYYFGLLDRFELTTVDFRFKVRGKIETRPEVVFIDMAEDSIKNIGRWPWQRQWHATMISILDQFKPRAVAFDVLFTEPSTNDDDDMMESSIAAAGNIYLPFLLDYDGDKISELVYPIQKFRDSVRGTGFLDVVPDVDGVIRRVPLVIKYEGKYLKQLSFRIVCDYLGVKDENIEVVPGQYILLKDTKKGDILIPVDENCAMMVNWAGKWVDTFKHFSYYETLLSYKQLAEEEKPVIDLNIYRGRICFIGLTAIGLYDTKPIPYEPLYPMVGIHGNIVNNILSKNFIEETSPLINIAIVFVLSILTGIFVYLLRPLFGSLISALIILLYLVCSFLLFKELGIFVGVVAPCMAVIFTYLILVIYKYLTEEKQRKWIKTAFSHYLSPHIIEQLIDNPDQLKLGGERLVLTVLFSDVRSFTTYSETHTPEEVVHVLNEYLDAMTKVILKHNGTIDKFVGDEIMAVYGSPVLMEPKEQARKATLTALEMMERLKELHKKWESEGKATFGIGIGANTGEMITGNMGSTEIFDYTVIGDNVNVGARVEALTRKYDTDIIVTEATYEYIKDEFIFRELDSIVVKGKTKPVKIFSVDGIKK